MRLARTKFRRIWELPSSHYDRSLEAITASAFGPPVVTILSLSGPFFIFEIAQVSWVFG